MEVLTYLLSAFGGAGVVILLLWKPLIGISRDRIKEQERRRTEEALEIQRQRYGVRRVQVDKFVDTQYDAYIQLWETLQRLHSAVEALWSNAAKENVDILSQELKDAKKILRNGSLYFDKKHYSELTTILRILEGFRVGKIRLIDIRSQDDFRYFSVRDMQFQIERNRKMMKRFEKLLETLRGSFQEKLSEIEIDTTA